MNGANTTLIAAAIAVVSALAAILTARTNRKAHEGQHQVSLSTEARGWVTQAQADAKEAKVEAEEARRTSQQANIRAHEAEIGLREVSAQTAALLRWSEHIVRAAHDPGLTDAEFRRIVNGGPPELTALKSRLPT